MRQVYPTDMYNEAMARKVLLIFAASAATGLFLMQDALPMRVAARLTASAAASQGSLSVHPRTTVSGGTVVVSWDGGELANTCRPAITDATRTDYAPWGSSRAGRGAVTTYSPLTVELTCIDSVGNYLPKKTLFIAVSDPQLYVSHASAPPGTSVTVTWDGGSLASACRPAISDGTRTDYAPWGSLLSGSGAVLVTSSMTVKLTCVDAQGNYMPTQTKSITMSGCDAGYSLSGGTCIPTTRSCSSAGGEGTQTFAAGQYGPCVHTMCMSGYTLLGGICSPTKTTTDTLRELERLDADRASLWHDIPSPWEVVWDGSGLPSENMHPHQWWNVPFDDDWNEVRVRENSFSFDNPSLGFMTVDRTGEEDIHKNGIIMKYDTELSLAAGFTMEFRVKMHPDSAEHAFNVIYSMGNGPTLAVTLSKDKVVAGGLGEERLSAKPPTAALDTTQFRTYRLVQPAASNEVYVFVDGSVTPLISAPGNMLKPNFFIDTSIPFVMIGSYMGHRPAHYTLDFVRYRRGGHGPGSGSLPGARVRTPPALPPFPLKAPVFTTILDGTKTPSQAGFTVYGSSTPWSVVGDGTTLYDTVRNPKVSLLILDPAPALTDNFGPLTVELRAKVLAGTTERGFGFTLLNALAGHSLVLSPDKVELFMGLKPAGYQAYHMDTTDGFHTYRFVRPQGSLLGYLYIDDDPVPAIIDQPGSADGWAHHPLIELGTMHFADRLNSENLRGKVLIDYFRVSPSAYAPALR